jgi:hypothetical protein
MQKETSETKSEIHLASLIAEAGEDARKRRQASMKAHADKLREIQRANAEKKK